MKINNVGAGIGSGLVDRIMEGERAPVEAAKTRRGHVVEQKNEYSSFSGMLSDLGKMASGMSMPSGFNRMQVESSHPDIMDGIVDGMAEIGTYEMEVRGLAQADKHLDVGFPDANVTPVGFGFMAIERDDGNDFEVVIDPGSTLSDVVAKINSSGAGVKAQVVNTGMEEDPFRLLVASEKTGEAAKVNIDTDTTFLDFKNIKAGRDLDVLFEDVEVKRPDNKLGDLLQGVKLDAKRAEPGTRVSINVSHDIDKTADGVKEFTSKYNEIAKFAQQQYQLNPDTQRGGTMMGDGNLRQIMRSLQSEIGSQKQTTGKFKNLVDVGVKTNAKSGELEIDEQKLKAALAEDYKSVSDLFVSGPEGAGLAERLSNAVKAFQDPEHGAIKNRLRSLDQSIKNQDKAIERQTERLAEKEATLTRQFSKLDSRMASLNAQGDFLSAKFGSQNTSQPAPSS